MMGGMLAGHDESAGDIVEENGKKFKLFYGSTPNIFNVQPVQHLNLPDADLVLVWIQA